MRHLLAPSTSRCSLLLCFCEFIFSPSHRIIGWGGVTNELHAFQGLKLFDLSGVPNTLNFQQHSKNSWNQSHPHIYDCQLRHQSPISDPSPADHNTCICSDHLRPYKARKSLWSLQRATEFIFNQLLNTSITVNLYSRDLDLLPKTGYFCPNNCLRVGLSFYVVNDLLTATNLEFHLDNPTMLSQQLITSDALNGDHQNEYS